MMVEMNPVYIIAENWGDIRFKDANGHKLLRYWLLRRGSMDRMDIICKRPENHFMAIL